MKNIEKWINEIINEEIKRIRLKENFGDEFSTKGTSRQALQSLMNYLDMKDISYHFDGPNEIISFDVTELGRSQQEIVRKILKPIQQEIVEGSSLNEIDDLAVDLIDFLGGSIHELMNWKQDHEIVKYFRNQGITDPIASKVYQRALDMKSDDRRR